MSWVIEGSDSAKEGEWKVLDTRKNIGSLNGESLSQVFEICEELEANEYFRFLRIRQTGYSAAEDNILTLSALEYFGSFI